MGLGTDETAGGYVNANCRGQRVFKLDAPMQILDRPEPPADRRWERACDGKKIMAAFSGRAAIRPIRTIKQNENKKGIGFFDVA